MKDKEEKCINCGGTRSWIYPRDCSGCGSLFIPARKTYNPRGSLEAQMLDIPVHELTDFFDSIVLTLLGNQ